MPGMDAGYPDEGDLYPETDEQHSDLLKWCNSAFIAADQARKPFEDKWLRFYKLYRSWVRKRNPGEWKSRVFIPIAFWVVETITPRLVAQLPKFVCVPVGPEDEQPAKTMETLLDHAANQSGLYEQLVDAVKSSLIYGTGILKTYYDEIPGFMRRPQPVMETIVEEEEEVVIDPETGQPLIDFDGNPVINKVEREYQIDTGEVEMIRTPFVKYAGPMAKTVDPWHFWVAPEAQNLDDARYVVHRSYRQLSYVKKKIKEGIYQLPPGVEDFDDDIFDTSDDPHQERLREVGLEGTSDPTRKDAELLEFWTDDGRLITMLNRKAIIRVQANPFDHSEKPFVHFVDYKVPNEFWGIGEIEPLEGLQDLQNALVNQRVDNVRLVMEAMFAVNVDNLEDPRDLTMRPGGVIRTKGDVRPDEVLHRIDLGDVTNSAFMEAEQTERTVEKVSGVSGLQQGIATSSLNDTATGMAILQEQGASRFGLKTKLQELMGLKRLGRHYGSNIQQFTTAPRMIRLLGPEGQFAFQSFDPEALQGALDYDIDPSSATQTETIRREQALSLLQVLAPYLQIQIDPMTGQPMGMPPGVSSLVDDVLDAFGKQDKQRYLQGTMPAPMQPPGMPPGMQQQQLSQMSQLAQGPEQYPGQNLAQGAVINASERFNQAQQLEAPS